MLLDMIQTQVQNKSQYTVIFYLFIYLFIFFWGGVLTVDNKVGDGFTLTEVITGVIDFVNLLFYKMNKVDETNGKKNFIISCRQGKIIPYCNVHCFTIGIVILLGLRCETLSVGGGGIKYF